MPPLTYIHASEAARTTAGVRAVDGGIFTPPTGRKWLKYRDSGARVAGDHKARLCPDKGRRRALWVHCFPRRKQDLIIILTI